MPNSNILRIKMTFHAKLLQITDNHSAWQPKHCKKQQRHASN